MTKEQAIIFFSNDWDFFFDTRGVRVRIRELINAQPNSVLALSDRTPPSIRYRVTDPAKYGSLFMYDGSVLSFSQVETLCGLVHDIMNRAIRKNKIEFEIGVSKSFVAAELILNWANEALQLMDTKKAA